MKNAFTLIELPVAIAISAMIFFGVFVFLNASAKTLFLSANKARSAKCIRFVAQRLCNDINESSGASLGSNTKKLVMADVIYEFKNGMLNRKEGESSYNLTVDGEMREMEFIFPSQKLIKIIMLPACGDRYEMNIYARN